MRKFNQALKFVERAERYAEDRSRLAGDGEAVARYVLDCAERVSQLDARVLPDAQREQFMARIWSAYEVVSDWLDSSRPYNLDSPEHPLYGDVLGDLGGSGEWDGCPGQVLVDAQYEGHD